MIGLRTAAFWLAAMVGAAVAVPELPPSLKKPKEEPKKEPEPNIEDLARWIRSSNLAEIRDKMFYLDALRTKEPVYVFRKDTTLANTKVSFQFKVEAVGQGERAVGLMFGSTGSASYHCIHIDRKNVILYRVTPGQPRLELDRRGGFTKPDGEWYEARVECQGPLIRVWFGDKYLFAFNSGQLQPGYVGFYASEGRAWVRRLDFEGQAARLPQAWK
ncbi:MAG: hypothetical protein FJ291_09425 [Planctomycetes bacterium]|nr:hypothetical protein [Planctomycetota bacterium]